jgi:hypothetical protein
MGNEKLPLGKSLTATYRSIQRNLEEMMAEKVFTPVGGRK